MAPKRPGHIERLPSGSYRVIVYAGTDPLTGRRLRFRQTVKTEEQAHILLGKMVEQVAEGKQPETGVTVAELLRQYMTVAELDRATRQTYEGYIRRTILPALGLIKLRKVRGPVLDMLYARLHQCGFVQYSSRTRNSIRNERSHFESICGFSLQRHSALVCGTHSSIDRPTRRRQSTPSKARHH